MFFSNEIVTYPAERASGKMAPNCGFAPLRPDISGVTSWLPAIEGAQSLA
jgi:hypothetical protein